MAGADQEEVTIMKALTEQRDAGALHRRSPIRFLVIWKALLRPLELLPVATVLFLLLASPTPIWAETEASPGQKEGKLEELARRFELLEGRLRENERQRGALVTEMQHLKADLIELQSGGTPLPGVGLALDSPTDSGEGRGHAASADDTTAEEVPVSGRRAHAVGQTGVTAGWDGGFYIRSSDGNFEFRPLGILQVDFRGHEDEQQINSDGTIATTFDIRRLRLGFEGFLFKDIDYSFEVNIDEDEVELIYA